MGTEREIGTENFKKLGDQNHKNHKKSQQNKYFINFYKETKVFRN